jgi:ribosomal protein S18 acetylase RimI-like enzyme
MLSIRKVNINSPGLREKILWIDKHCYKRDVRFNEETLDNFLDKNSTVYYVISKVKRETIVGYMLLYLDGKELYLTSVAILKTYRGSGVGKNLFNTFLRQGKGRKLSLHAVNPAMIHIAEKHGFKKVRTTQNYYGKVNAVLMARDKNE